MLKLGIPVVLFLLKPASSLSLSLSSAQWMDRSFEVDLVAKHVHAEIIERLNTLGLTSRSLLANFCDSKQDVSSRLCDSCLGLGGESKSADIRRTEEARIIQVWREAEALEQARNANPLNPEEAPTPEELERPMDLKVVETYSLTFFKCYNFSLSDFEILWAHLLGRINKEHKNNNYEVIHVDRVGTLRESSRSKATKRIKLATDLSIPIITTSEALVRDVSLNYIYYQLLEVLLVGGYALLGTFEVPGKGRWCSLQSMRDYFVFVRNRCCPIVGEPPDLRLVQRADEATRADWAVELRKGATLDQAVEIVNHQTRAAHWLWSAGMEVEQVRSLVDGRAALPGGIHEDGDQNYDGDDRWRHIARPLARPSRQSRQRRRSHPKRPWQPRRSRSLSLSDKREQGWKKWRKRLSVERRQERQRVSVERREDQPLRLSCQEWPEVLRPLQQISKRMRTQ